MLESLSSNLLRPFLRGRENRNRPLRHLELLRAGLSGPRTDGRGGCGTVRDCPEAH